MPITLDQKRQLVQAHGLDPSEYTTDNDGNNIIPITDVNTGDVQPTAGPQVFTPKILPIPPQFQMQQPKVAPAPQNNPLQTFGKTFAEEAPSAVGSGLGAAGGLALGTALAPETGGLSFLIPLLSAIGGGWGGGALTRKIQSSIEPESIQANVAQAAQENPKSALLGRLATIPLSGFNPSPSNLVKAGGTIGKLATTVPFGEDIAQVISNPEIQNLMNVGIGAGLGAGQTVAEQLIHGQPLSPKDILMSAATGAVFNKPNVIGRRLGFHTPENNDIYQQLQGTLKPGEPTQQPTQQPQVNITITPDNYASFENMARNIFPGEENRTTPVQPKPTESTTTKEPYNHLFDENYPPKPEKELTHEEELARMEGEGGEPANFKLIEAERLKKLEELKAETLPDTGEHTQQGGPFITAADKERARLQKLGQLDNPPKGTTKSFPESRFSSESALTKSQEESLPELTKLSPAREFYDIFKRYGVEQKGISIDDSGEVVDSQGRPMAGETVLENGLPQAIKLSSTKAGADTPMHELYHAFVATLRQSDRAADQRLVSRYDDIVSKDPDYLSWKAKRDEQGFDSTPEEYQATNQGYEFLNKLINSREETPFTKWKNDFQAYLRTRFTKHADTADYQRLLNNYLVNDTRKLGVESGLGGNVTSKNATPSNEEDYNRYQEIQARMKQLAKDQSFGDEFGKLWQESENIKNRNPIKKGVPPSKPIDEVKNSSESSLWSPTPSEDNNFLQDLRKAEIDRLVEKKNMYLKRKIDNDISLTPEQEKNYNAVWERLDKIYRDRDKETYLKLPLGSLYGEDKDAVKYATPSSLPTINSRAADINDTIKGKNISKLDWITTPIFRSQLDTIERTQGPEGKVASKALATYYPMKDNYLGQSMAPILQSLKGLSKEDVTKVNQTGIQESRDRVDYRSSLTPKQQKLYDAVRAVELKRQQDQIAANQPVKSGTIYSLPTVDPFSWPQTVSPQAIEILSKHPNSPVGNDMRNDYINHYVTKGLTHAEAEAKWDEMMQGYEKGKANLTKFNAIRKAEPLGLPDSMLRDEPIKDFYRYYNRVAADRAWHDTVETNPDNAKVLGVTKDAWGNPIVSPHNDISASPELKAALERIHGEPFDESMSKLKAFNRIATSLMLGPLTNVHIMAGSLANSFQYLHPLEAPKAYSYALTHLTDSYQHTLETGYNKKNLSSVRDLFDVNSTAMEKLNAIASTIGNLSGRDATNNFTKSLLQGLGEWLVNTRSIQANNGDKAAATFMSHVDPEYTTGKTYSPDELNRVASNFASLIHGAHDPRTLPGWMLKDTAIQPFFSLASWNIAQTNQWLKHVLTPAREGNFIPLIMSTLGAVAGGLVVKELRERLADKKSAIPSLQQIAASSRGISGNLSNVAYNLMAMSSYTGYAGIYSVLGKAAEDLAHKNIPQGAAFPLDEVISNPVHRASQFLSAMMNDPSFDYVKAGTKFVGDLLKENVQLGRIGLSWLANVEGIPGMQQENYLKALNQKSSELRKFQMVEGMPYDAQTAPTGNPYMDMAEKSFKRTQDLGEASSMLPDLIQSAFEKSNKAGGSIEVLKSELAKLKTAPYETMPSPERMPLAFMRYMNFLSQTQGPEEASKRFTDYLMHNQVNKIKGKMVPTL